MVCVSVFCHITKAAGGAKFCECAFLQSWVNMAIWLLYSSDMGHCNLSHFYLLPAAMRAPIAIGLTGLFLASCSAPTPPVVLSKPVPVKQTTADVPDTALDNKSIIAVPASDNQTPSENEVLISDIDKALEAHKQNLETAPSDNQSADDDVIASIIWELEQSDNQTALSQTQDTQDRIVTFEELIPEGRDPSLEEEALDAAFAMLRAPKLPATQMPVTAFDIAPKDDGQSRIGVFVPRSGPGAIYGSQVIDGLEMALFQINDPRLEVLYFDSANEAMIASHVSGAIEAEVDIAIGPLFSQTAVQAYPYFAAAQIPVLSLSNNETIARSGLWILGLVPEQQIDVLLAEAVLNGYDNIAILSDYSDYGGALTKHITSRLSDFGLSAARVTIIDGTVGADDEGLVASLKDFTHYKPLDDNEFITDIPPPYDAVILAGGADFVLKVAPLLSYYDLGPDRVLYLGTDLWASAGLLGEPSLQGSYISTINPSLREAFGARFDALYEDEAGSFAKTASFLNQLGFDAMAVAATATRPSAVLAGDNQTDILQSPVVSQLLQEAGFKGYTGAFRLLADGRNHRSYTLFQISDGALAPVTMTPKAF